MYPTIITSQGQSSAPAIAFHPLPFSAILLLLFLLSSCAKNQVTYPTHTPSDTASTRNALKVFYSDWQGVPYAMGGMSQSSIDCSGLTVLAYRDLFGMQLPRTAEEQAQYGRNISKNSLQPGDLVFFKTGFFQRHVGIYLDKNAFIHASTSKGVMISQLDEPYWRAKFWKAQRVIRL